MLQDLTLLRAGSKHSQRNSVFFNEAACNAITDSETAGKVPPSADSPVGGAEVIHPVDEER